MSDRPSIPIACASANNAQTDCRVQSVGSLVRLVGHAQMDFTSRDAYFLAKAIQSAIDPCERIHIDEIPKEKVTESLIFLREMVMHYRCPSCDGKWTIGDGRSYGGYFCPHCGSGLEI